jgi:hypothetical protein
METNPVSEESFSISSMLTVNLKNQGSLDNAMTKQWSDLLTSHGSVLDRE